MLLYVSYVLHSGHSNIIKGSSKLGKVIVGALTDEAVASYRSYIRLRYLTFAERKSVVSAIRGVLKAVPQETLAYRSNLEKYLPDFLVHDCDWKTGVQQTVQQQVAETSAQWGGTVADVPYTPNISSTKINSAIKAQGSTADRRRRQLRRLLQARKLIRVFKTLISNMRVFSGPLFLEVITAVDNRKDIGHPTNTPMQKKLQLMRYLNAHTSDAGLN